MIEGRVVYSATDAVRVAFRRGPGEPFALGVTNGRSGRHRLTYADGAIVWVESTPAAHTILERGDGTALGVITRADTSTAVGATAGTLFHFVPDREAVSADLFRLRVLDRMGRDFAHLDVVRTAAGWATGRSADEHWESHLWWDRSGPVLPVPILGTRLLVRHRPDRDERDVLLAACVDITLGLRPYVAEMM